MFSDGPLGQGEGLSLLAPAPGWALAWSPNLGVDKKWNRRIAVGTREKNEVRIEERFLSVKLKSITRCTH